LLPPDCIVIGFVRRGNEAEGVLVKMLQSGEYRRYLGGRYDVLPMRKVLSALAQLGDE
jgi:hypothetical protein